MPESLLNLTDVCRRLGKISKCQFYKIEPVLIAKGLKKLKIGYMPTYSESSLDTVLNDLFQQENPVIEVPVKPSKGQHVDVIA